MKYITLILIIVCGLCVSLEAGEIYEWIDKDGVKHFTQEAPPPDATILNEKTEITSPDAVQEKDTKKKSETPEKEITKQDAANSQPAPAVSSDYVDTDENDIDEPGVLRREEKHQQHKKKMDHTDNLDKTGDEPKKSRSQEVKK
jgi:hypothetical protein